MRTSQREKQNAVCSFFCVPVLRSARRSQQFHMLKASRDDPQVYPVKRIIARIDCNWFTVLWSDNTTSKVHIRDLTADLLAQFNRCPGATDLYIGDPNVFSVEKITFVRNGLCGVRWTDKSETTEAIENVSKDLILEFRANVGYQNNLHGQSPNKVALNIRFASLVRKTSSTANILFLDEGNTSMCLHKHGLLKHRFAIVPNPSDAIVQGLHPEVCGIRGTVSEVMADSLISNLEAVWLDYTCTYHGSATNSPQRDLRMIFKQHKMKRKSWLMMTLCLRDKRFSDRSKLLVSIKKDIRRSAKFGGYNLVFQSHEKYRNMVCLLCRVI